jgi:branched-subunit amino acid permease
MAVTSLVLGILWIGGLGSLLALIFGIIGLRSIDQSEGAETGRGLAIAGIVLGAVGVGFIVLIVAVAFLGSAASSKFDQVGNGVGVLFAM